MRPATLLLVALTACGGAPFRVDVAPDDAGPGELDAGGDAIAAHVVAEASVDSGSAFTDAGPTEDADGQAGDAPRPDPSPDGATGAPDAPTFPPEAGPDAPVEASAPRPVCCALGTTCHSTVASCALASNGTPTCYCGSARACAAADLGAYCYLIDGCSGTVTWCP